MKKIANTIFFKGLIAMAIVSAISTAPGCNNSKDYSKEGDSTVLPAPDTAMVNKDTAMKTTETPVMTEKDTATVMAPADASKVPMAKTNMVKAGKKKKGKVSIVAATSAADKNAAMEMDKEGYYKNTEVLPSFPGGQKALEKFFEKNIQYPEAATENETQGTVRLTFAVDENGKIYQPTPVGDKIGNGIEEEAIRVFNKMPTWTPGKIKGKNVKTRFTLPIKFELY